MLNFTPPPLQLHPHPPLLQMLNLKKVTCKVIKLHTRLVKVNSCLAGSCNVFGMGGQGVLKTLIGIIDTFAAKGTTPGADTLTHVMVQLLIL